MCPFSPHWPTRLSMLAIALCTLLPTGCGPTGGDDAGRMPGATDSQLTIAVDAFQGPNRNARARDRMRRYEQRTGMDGFFLRERSGRMHVYHGRYDLDAEPAAEADLRRLREHRQAGRITGELLAVVPLPERAAADASAMDLRNAVEGAVYSLQIGVYDPGYDGDYRQAAERKAAELREQGHDAYFFHGPNRSMVTLGAFARGAFVQSDQPGQPMRYHPYIQRLREEFPHNLRNGEPFVEGRDPDTNERVIQKSFLVTIPGR